jgi:hypothetical protein
MKSLLIGLGLLAFLAATPEQQPSISYFRYMRDVSLTSPAAQSYIVMDADLWEHTRFLSDIRLYDGETQVPYLLQEEKASTSSREQQVLMLNLGMSGEEVQFDLELGAIPEYDRVRLQMTAQNFVATADIEGRASLHDTHGVKIGHFTLYDFTHEKLGSNFVLRLPQSSFRFLHVKLSRGLHAEQIKAALVSNVEEKKAVWTDVAKCELAAGEQSATTYNCSLSEAVPVDRIAFQVAAGKINFRRYVTVADASGAIVASNNIDRIKMDRQGQSIVSENLAFELPGVRSKAFKITVQNGDDAPLPVGSVRLLSTERRIYFDPQKKSSFKLYFGDEKLAAPDYDYAKFFHEDSSATRARLGPVAANPAFTGRPDDRPWSERHKVIVWLAMLLAVGVLAAMAMRGFKSDVKSV